MATGHVRLDFTAKEPSSALQFHDMSAKWPKKAPKNPQNLGNVHQTPRNQARALSCAMWLQIRFRGHLVHPHRCCCRAQAGPMCHVIQIGDLESPAPLHVLSQGALCVPCCTAVDVLFHTAPCHAARRPVHLRTLCCSAFGAAPPRSASRLTLNSFPTRPNWLCHHCACGGEGGGFTFCVLRLTAMCVLCLNALRVLRRPSLCAPCHAAASGAVLL